MLEVDWKRLARTTFQHQCPACGEGDLFSEGYRIHDRCPSCGTDLRGEHGAHYGGPIILGYTVGGLSGLVVLGVLGWRFGLRTWVIWTSVAAVVLSIFPAYRTCKAFWVWFLYATDEIGEAGEWREG